MDMFADVLVARRLPRALWTLTYEVPPALVETARVGCLVHVPFGKTMIVGVITALHSEPPTHHTKIKPLADCIGSKPFLNAKTILFNAEVAARYQTPPGFLLKAALPPLTKKFIKQSSEVLATATQQRQMSLVGSADSQLAVRYFSSPDLELQLWKELAKRLHDQTFILVPQTEHCQHVYRQLPPAAQKTAFIVTSESKTKDVSAAWLAVLGGGTCTIIGTRSALWLPWSKLASVIVYDDANPSHKSWDMAPRFAGYDVAQLLAQIHGETLRVATHTPSLPVARAVMHAEGAATPTTIPAFETSIVRMRDERRSGNATPLAEEVWQILEHEQTGAIFLFLNRLGDAQFLACQECNAVLRCPQCETTLSVYRSAGKLLCRECGHVEPLPLQCKKCGASHWLERGLGIDHLERVVRQRLGSQRRIIRLERTTHAGKALAFKPNDIIIGTQFAWNKLDWSSLAHCVFVDPDAALFMPDPQASFDLWHSLRDACARLAHPPIIQTNHPEHLLYTSLSAPHLFYDAELAAAGAFGAFPYSIVVKMYAGFASAPLAAAAARALINILTPLTKDAMDTTIAGALPSQPPMVRGEYWYVVLAKISADAQAWERVKKLVALVPDTWKVDINPRSRLSLY